MARVFVGTVGLVAGLNATNTPLCSVNGASGGKVITFSDGQYSRCMSVITPSNAQQPMPVVFWFHGSGGSAAHCGSNSKMVSLAESTGFAYVCGEATQGVFGNGGQWNIPATINDQTGTPCSSGDSVEVNYMKNGIAELAKQSNIYDTSRIFTSGCSMGSAFSGYMGNCLKQWNPQQISAFATHSTGLKVKGDGNKLPENWGECSNCKYWPFAPKSYKDDVGLKACIFDNTGDGDFYKTSQYLAQIWPQLGNPSESHFASGGHCQNIPYSDIVKCLGVGGSSPRPPTPPTPTPSPVPTPPTPSPEPTPPSPSPAPSPIPGGEPSAECLQCWQSVCSAKQVDCGSCMKSSKDSCVSTCKPSLFGQKMMDWFCNLELEVLV